MRSIEEWQKALKAAADRKFPKSGWGESERLASLRRQLDDVEAAFEVEREERVSDEHGHQDLDHRIGALIADALIFAQERGADMEQELQKVLAWFEGRD
jgi:hypothetical protein